jgi:hypothetical protein
MGLKKERADILQAVYNWASLIEGASDLTTIAEYIQHLQELKERLMNVTTVETDSPRCSNCRHAPLTLLVLAGDHVLRARLGCACRSTVLYDDSADFTGTAVSDSGTRIWPNTIVR